jgi:hypothetical protein
MRLRTRVAAAAIGAATVIAAPAALATASSTASAADLLCVHLFIKSASQGVIIDEHILLPSLTIAPGSCPDPATLLHIGPITIA